MKHFPTLYKKNSKGKIQTWIIGVDEINGMGVITTTYGQEGGKIQNTTDTIKEGKNLGKANATTAYEQACLEAESKWKAQQERDSYVQNKDQAGEDLRDGDEPMLAHRYDKYPEKMPFPCAIQPKLDGHRCVAIVKNGVCELYSRTRTLITGVPHINEALANAFKDQDITLDGELYNHDYKSKFEELTGFIRSQEPKPGHEVVHYCVYDLVDMDLTFGERHEKLFDMVGSRVSKAEPIKLVSTQIIPQEMVVDQFKYYISMGYEGAMLRNLNSKYEQRRSYGLMKVKEFEDAEFKIVGIKEGRGKLAGHAIFECVAGEERFDVKLKGTERRLKEIFQNQPQYIGQLLTVQFQGKTKNGIPRFPVGVRLRQDV